MTSGGNDGFNGSSPTAIQIADAIIDRQRDRLTGGVQKFTGTATNQLAVPGGTRGNLVAISDTGGGLVQFTTDGSNPTNNAGANRGEATGPYLAVNLKNVDLSQLRFNATSNAGDYTVYYEIYS